MSDDELIDLIARYSAEQRADEVVWFYRACEAIRPRVIVEIGFKLGGNLKILSTHLDDRGIAVGIDKPWNVLPDLRARCRVHQIRGDSHEAETKNRLLEILDARPIDVLFIDGDHSTDGMLQDYADYAPLVRCGGIIAVHDIYYLDEVAAAWAQIPGPHFESARCQSSIGIGYVVKQ
jgi:cephalosporin hydroxylase